MDFAKKRKLNALLNGLGTRPSYPTDSTPPPPSAPAPEDESAPRTPPPNRTSTATLASASSTTRTPGPDAVAMRSSISSAQRPAATTSDLDLLTKRRRLGLADSTPSKDLSTKTPDGGGQTTISNIVLKKWGGNRDKDPIFKPKYCPADRDELLRRLASFQELTDWTPKPNPVAEVQWAKRGWICQGKERVRCTLCNKELVVKLNRKEVDGKEVAVLVPSEIEDALVARYVGLIVSSHQEDCLWRKRGCDDSLLRLPLSSRHAAIQDLRARYDELCARRDFLPYEFNLRLPARLDVDAVLRYLPPEFFSSSSASPPARAAAEPNRVALALAVLGWQGLSNPRIGPVPNTASCHTCLRRLGLWMFKSKEVDPDTGAVVVPAPMGYLDPLREHRFFCPWSNADAQRITPPRRGGAAAAAEDDEENRPGWEVLLQALKNEAYLRSRDSPQQSRAGGGGAGRQPQTPSSRRSGQGEDAGGGHGDGDEEEEEDEKTQNAKDKERWKRLRRVKSLLGGKGGNKLRKSITLSRPGSSAAKSRPGTSHSTAQGEDGAAQGGDGDAVQASG